MPTFYPSINPDLQAWALAQPLFFTATAPLHGSHINVSPKGLASSTLAVLGPNKAAYLDATGSGCETISHLYENGRITLMWCSFETSPRIMRWFCRGRVVEAGAAEWEEWRGKFDEEFEGARAVIVCDVWKVQTSCGYGVPIAPKPGPPKNTVPKPIKESRQEEAMEEGRPEDTGDVEEAGQKKKNSKEKGGDWFSDRPTLSSFAHKQVAASTMAQYQAKNNTASLDGLPGLRIARREKRQWLVVGDARARVGRVLVGQLEGLVFGVLIGWVVTILVMGQ